MNHCTQCGHVLGLGRFCTNCGHPVAARHADPLSDPIDLDTPTEPAPAPDAAGPGSGGGVETLAQDWRTDTAERNRLPGPPADAGPDAGPVAPPTEVRLPPATEARLPPAVGEAPPPPRFPLFADEAASGDVPGPAPTQVSPAPAVVQPGTAADDSDDWDEWEDWDDADRRPRAAWVLGGFLLLAALVLGGWLLGRALGGDGDEAGDGPSAGGGTNQADDPADDPVDHTAQASAKAPRTAPSTQDVEGNPTSYDAGNMLDGLPETAWRVAGDGSGLKLVFTFPEKTRISEVGLVNGYAKTATDAAGTTFDWYAGHRRVTEVTWIFGAGDVVRQALDDDSTTVQTVEVGPVEVRKVVLKIVTTTPPGEGPARRDFTAISDVLLAG